MVEKTNHLHCVPKNNTFDCIQWNWNFVDVNKFCDGRINWREKLDGKLILYGKNGPQSNQEIRLGDYIIKKNNIYFDVLSEEDFNKMYDIVK